MLTKTHFHGNIEEMRKLIQQTDGLTQLVDLLLVKKEILLNQQLKLMSMISSEIKLSQHLGLEMMPHIQLMEVLNTDGVMVILHIIMLRSHNLTLLHKEILLTKRLDQMFGLL